MATNVPICDLYVKAEPPVKCVCGFANTRLECDRVRLTLKGHRSLREQQISYNLITVVGPKIALTLCTTQTELLEY